jgi:hypothetical protein
MGKWKLGGGYDYETDCQRKFWMRTMTVAIVVGITLKYAGFFWGFIATCLLALAFMWWDKETS